MFNSFVSVRLCFPLNTVVSVQHHFSGIYIYEEQRTSYKLLTTVHNMLEYSDHNSTSWDKVVISKQLVSYLIAIPFRLPQIIIYHKF